MSVYAPAADYFWELLRSFGIDPEPVFTRAAIDPNLRFDPNARVPRSRMNSLYRAVWQATGDSAFGLRVASTFHPSHLGALGYSWLASPSLLSAWRKLQRYSKIDVDSFHVATSKQGREFHVGFSWDGAWEPIPPQIYTMMALLVHLCRSIAGQDMRFTRLEMAAPKPGDMRPFAAYFGCEMHFERDQNLLVMPLVEVDRLLPRAHPELEKATDEMVIRYLAHREKTDIVNRVRAALFERIDEGEVTVEQVAEQLHVSVRTLRRRLEEEGWNFRRLLTDVRQQLAHHYLKDKTLSLTEISYRLGFTQPSSFTRAFRGWTGKSPTEAREAPSS